jgi:hypothetical protein
MVERVVYVGSVMQVIVHLASGQTLQAWVQNQGEGFAFEQGTAVAVHLPAEALRVLVDSTPIADISEMEEETATR